MKRGFFGEIQVARTLSDIRVSQFNLVIGLLHLLACCLKLLVLLKAIANEADICNFFVTSLLFSCLLSYTGQDKVGVGLWESSASARQSVADKARYRSASWRSDAGRVGAPSDRQTHYQSALRAQIKHRHLLLEQGRHLFGLCLNAQQFARERHLGFVLVFAPFRTTPRLSGRAGFAACLCLELFCFCLRCLACCFSSSVRRTCSLERE